MSDPVFDRLLQAEEAKAAGTQPATNSTFDLLMEMEDRKKARATANLSEAVNVNPDQYSTDKRVASYLGYPVAAVQALPDLKTQAQVQQIQTNAQSNPTLAERYTDADFAKLAHDDSGPLAKLGKFTQGITSGWTQADSQGEMADLLFAELNGKTLSAPQAQRLAQLKAQNKRLGREQEREGVLGFIGRTTAYSVRQLGSSIYNTAQGIGYGGVAGAGAGSVIPGVGTVAGGAAGMTAGALTAGVNYSYKLEAAFAFDEFRDLRDVNGQPIPLDVVRTAAKGVGTVNALLETAAGAAVARMIPGVKEALGNALGGDAAKAAVRNYTRTALANPVLRSALVQAIGKMSAGALVEGTEEFFQTLVSAGGREVAQAASGQTFKPDSLGADVREALGAAGEATVGTFFALAPLGGMTYRSVRRQQRYERDLAEAQESGQRLADALTAASESKLRTRSPETFQALVQKMAEDQPGAPATVHIDAQVLAQSVANLPAGELERLLPSAAAQLAEALTTNRTVEVPVGEALTNLPGTPLEQVFLQNARKAPDAPSLADTQQAGEKAEQFLKQEAERVMQQAKDQGAWQQSMQSVKDTIKQQLDAAGRFSSDVNDAYAQLQANFFSAMAARTKMTPDQLYQRWSLKVAAQGQQGSGVFNAQRPGALTVEGYHYSKQARPVVSTAAFGTGLAGSNRELYLNAPDERLRRRAYFYVDKGTGINPEAGVGGIAQKATLSNIYDGDADPLRLKKGGQLAFESAVLDAGYSGYLTRLDGTQSGQVIMLGDQAIQTQAIGPAGKLKGAVVPAPAARQSIGRDVVVDALNAAQGLPVGSPTRERWSQILKTQLPDVHAALQAAGVFEGNQNENLYKSDLVKAFEAATEAPVYNQSVSTRLPTAKKALENPLEEMLIIGLDAAKMDPAAFEANMAIVRAYRNMPVVEGETADQTAERFIQHVVDNLLYLHDQVPEDIRQRSKLWYDGARAIVDRWAPKYGLTDAQVSAVLAVLSPQKDWFMNVSLAERVLDTMTGKQDHRWDQAMADKVNEILIKTEEEQKALATAEGADYEVVDPSRYFEAIQRIQGKTLGEVIAEGNDRDVAIWVRVYDQAYNTRNYRIVSPEGDFKDWKRNAPSKAQAKKGEQGSMGKVAWGSFGEIGKAVSVIRDGSIENISAKLGGQHKVRNFYNNIFNPQSEHGDVTIDTHAVAAALLRPLAGGSDEVKHNFGSGGVSNSGVFGAKGTYGIYAEAYRRAAAQRGILAREMQSITWEAVRGLFQAEQKKSLQVTVNAVWDKYRTGEVTLDDARQQTLTLAKGIENPDWVAGPDAPGAGQAWASSYSEELARAELPVRGGDDGRGAVGNAGRDQGAGVLNQGGVNGGLEQAGDGAGRAAGAGPAPLPGAPVIEGATGPDPRLVAVAEQYARDNGIDLKRQAEYVQVDPERAARIAQAYEEMQHAPNDPAVQEAYQNLIKQTVAQYRALEAAGYRFWFIDPENDPYKSPWDAMREMRASQTMGVFPTVAGFGSGATDVDISDNPLMDDTGVQWPYGSLDGELKPVLANDLFRAVHDAFGHGLEGAGFRAQGEENAWQAHIRLFTGSAKGAITSETRGQNSWLNFGPYGETNRTAKVEDTVFADQKTGLMPEWTWTEGLAPDMQGDALEQGARGTFNPQALLVTLNENADLSTFIHESGHFFLDVMADLAADPNTPAEVKADMDAVLKWFGVKDLDTWRNYTLDQKRPYHEKWAESFEQYILEGKAPSQELQPLFRRFRSFMLSVYKSLTQFMRGRDLKVNDEIRKVFDRMLATDEEIAAAEEAAGMLPDFDATNEAIEALQARSLRDLKWTLKARSKFLKQFTKEANDLRKALEAEVRGELESTGIYRAIKFLRTGEIDVEGQTNAQRKAADSVAGQNMKLSLDALKEMYGDGPAAPWRYLPTGKKGIAAKDGVHPDIVADMLGDPAFPNGDALVRAILAADPIDTVIEGMVDQRMLERHGELATQEALEAAANEAVHNAARARSLATELKSQAEMLNPRQDTGRVDSRGRPITVNAIVEAAKQFAQNLAARRRVKDLKNAIWQHRAAEARAARAWTEATKAGDTQAAVKAKQDQVLNNAVVKALQDAQAEVKKSLEFFKRITKGNNEKLVKGGRDPDVVNAMRAILAAYDITPRLEKGALEYLAVLEKNDPSMYAGLQPSIAGAMNNAKPLGEMSIEELRALREEMDAMWHLAKRSRQMEVDGNLIDIEDAAGELQARMQDIGVPDSMPGDKGAITDSEKRARWLQHAGSLLRRVEQWAEGMDGKFGGPFLRLVFQPVKEAANRYRADRVKYRQAYQALVDEVAPFLRKGEIDAPELGYTFGKGHNGIGHAELLHAILHTGNDSNKRKLLLGRGWAVENADGTMDTSNWDKFIDRMIGEGVLSKEHFDFAQGVWDLLEQTKPLAQKTHRDVFGRYFDEVAANEFTVNLRTPDNGVQPVTYRGGYVPAQADPRIVADADLRKLAEAENENMAYSFPATNKGFTKGRVEYNRPLLLDLRTIGQHIDKVLLFSHMEPAVRDVQKLLTQKGVGYSLSRIDPTIYTGMLTPWLNRSARQIVEAPVVGDGGISRVLSAARSRAGMALMFANVSNAIQQLTGFSTAFAKIKSDGLESHMMRATAQFIRSPREFAKSVAAASPFMNNRMENEIAAINDAMDAILLDPSLYEKAQAWTRKHAYFLQTALANTMEPIIWAAGYNGAIQKGMSEADALRYADGLIRQTQGSTLPEDVSRIETGPAYARMFTQFIGYFNMMANTNASGLKQIAADTGMRKGAGKALLLVTFGMLVPIWAAEAIAQAMRGGPEDEDDDGYLDDWLASVFGMGTIKGALAMVPFVGQLANAGINRFNSNPADDRISMSPAVGMLESAVAVPMHVYKALTDPDKLNRRTAVRDVATAVSIATGLPAVAVARPLGYLAGIADDKIEPTGPVDAARGLITGTPSPESKAR